MTSVLSVVVPAFNEERGLARTIEEILDAASTRQHAVEILVVDDGSKDCTFEVAKSYCIDPRVRVFRTAHIGKGHALRTGIAHSTGAAIVFCDADLPVPANAILDLAMCARARDDVLCVGTRIPATQGVCVSKLPRICMAWAYRRYVRAIVPGLPSDPNSCAKVAHGEWLRSSIALSRENGFAFDVELMLIALTSGIRITEFDVPWHDKRRTRGTLRFVVQGARCALRVAVLAVAFMCES